ncbi:HD-GYP domain-containing protein [Elstera litoralis]|uniref:HD-GYP domain-containing protein n=1 Tax=Elstera litoralis TaxID=552518 RepID=UPI0018DDA49C|nr:HD domain-containing phosphohydrolase [Elstera litoralis]
MRGRTFLSIGAEIALGHHEKWNGTGYPRGLKGKDIPLSARIVAVADVFDALTSKRPYKEAWPRQEAIDWIKARTDIDFDPEIVSAFLSVVEG